VAIHVLKASDVAKLIDTKPGKHPDGGGLYLQVNAPGRGSWIYRHQNKWRSLGPADILDLTEARDKALALRKAALGGQCPIAMLDGGTAPGGKTFGDIMALLIEDRYSSWSESNRDHNKRRYEYLFGKLPWFTALPIDAIDQDAINRALATWPDQPKVRSDVRSYIKAIRKFAVEGGRDIKREVVPLQSMTYTDVPAFYKRLAQLGTEEARALQFVILSGVRVSEIVGTKERLRRKPAATWGEITGNELFRPARVMKIKQDFTVALTPAMLKLLGKKRQADDVPLFNTNSGKMLDTLRKITGNGDTTHGFRTSLVAWGLKVKNYPDDLLQHCIAHETRSVSDRSYSRGDLLENRRPVMEAWSDYVNS
jgi:integrase